MAYNRWKEEDTNGATKKSYKTKVSEWIDTDSNGLIKLSYVSRIYETFSTEDTFSFTCI